jgi:hypothetical protein
MNREKWDRRIKEGWQEHKNLRLEKSEREEKG